MKKLFIAPGLFILLLFNAENALSQLTITDGAQFIITGNLQVTLSNTDLLNSGNLLPGSGTISFTGNTSSVIGGGQTSRFYNLQVNKSAGNVILLKPISAGQQISFTSGLLDLNGFDIDLGTTGSLNGEQESSHVIGANGGTIIFNTTLNAPSSANPGNLGLLITSAQNLGNTTIKRGQQSQANGSGTGNSILRYYDILPAGNTALNATLRFPYFIAELNGLDENSLILWGKQAPADWNPLGFDSRNTTANYVEKNGVSAPGRFTLSSVNNALPVRFISFNAGCNGNKVVLSWKTATEINSDHYTAERSSDGVLWTSIGTIPAAGNAAVENNYSFTDNAPVDNGYYRVAEYDRDAQVQFTKVLRAACGYAAAFRIWPNPVSDVLYFSVSSAVNAGAIIKLFDGKGALVKQQAVNLVRGNNLLSIDVKGMAAGLYYATILHTNGQLQMQKIMKE